MSATAKTVTYTLTLPTGVHEMLTDAIQKNGIAELQKMFLQANPKRDMTPETSASHHIVLALVEANKTLARSTMVEAQAGPSKASPMQDGRAPSHAPAAGPDDRTVDPGVYYAALHSADSDCSKLIARYQGLCGPTPEPSFSMGIVAGITMAKTIFTNQLMPQVLRLAIVDPDIDAQRCSDAPAAAPQGNHFVKVPEVHAALARIQESRRVTETLKNEIAAVGSRNSVSYVQAPLSVALGAISKDI